MGVACPARRKADPTVRAIRFRRLGEAVNQDALRRPPHRRRMNTAMMRAEETGDSGAPLASVIVSLPPVHDRQLCEAHLAALSGEDSRNRFFGAINPAGVNK